MRVNSLSTVGIFLQIKDINILLEVVPWELTPLLSFPVYSNPLQNRPTMRASTLSTVGTVLNAVISTGHDLSAWRKTVTMVTIVIIMTIVRIMTSTAWRTWADLARQSPQHPWVFPHRPHPYITKALTNPTLQIPIQNLTHVRMPISHFTTHSHSNNPTLRSQTQYNQMLDFPSSTLLWISKVLPTAVYFQLFFTRIYRLHLSLENLKTKRVLFWLQTNLSCWLTSQMVIAHNLCHWENWQRHNRQRADMQCDSPPSLLRERANFLVLAEGLTWRSC